MRKNFSFLLLLLGFFFSQMALAQQTFMMKYDPASVDKFLYRVEGFSSNDYHLAYHVHLKEGKKVILNVAMQSFENTAAAVYQYAQNSQEMGFDLSFIDALNQGVYKLNILTKDGERYFSYDVASAIFVEETPFYVTYSGKFYSFFYDKTKDYSPADNVDYGMIPHYTDVRFLANGTSTVGCLRVYDFIKVIIDTHPKGSFCMVSDADFTKLNPDQLLAICQKPLPIRFIENVGIYSETTTNASLQLISINDLSFETFLSTKCGEAEAFTATPPVFQTEENTSKGNEERPTLTLPTTVYKPTPPEREIPTSYETDNNGDKTSLPQLRFYTRTEGNSAPDSAKVVLTTPVITPNDGTNLPLIHIVDNDETLYSLSRRYKVKIQQIKDINGLIDDKIFVTQKLIIPQ